MDRTERLLDLVALLLDAHEPVSWAELKESFPEDYGSGSDEATERKFERDKAELLELGITPEEMAVLYAAGSAVLASGAFPGRHDLQHALRKIGFFAGGQLARPRVRMELGAVRESAAVPEHLETLWSAASARKWVEIVYASPKRPDPSTRKVDPYGLVLRRGVWSLVGYCHLRQGLRTFHVHRIRALKMNASKPRTHDFEVPEGFAIDAHVPHAPWQWGIEPAVEVRLELQGPLADQARA